MNVSCTAKRNFDTYSILVLKIGKVVSDRDDGESEEARNADDST